MFSWTAVSVMTKPNDFFKEFNFKKSLWGGAVSVAARVRFREVRCCGHPMTVHGLKQHANIVATSPDNERHAP